MSNGLLNGSKLSAILLSIAIFGKINSIVIKNAI